MKYKITEREIKAIANGEADIKDLFPDVFNVKLEVGKVYKSTFVNKEGIKSKFIAYIQDVEGMKNYGFNFFGEFDNNMYFSNESNTLKEATQKEWEEALIKEAERRGYEEGIYFKSIIGDNNFLIKGSCLKYGWNNQDCLYEINSSGLIFKDGVWATIIPTLTKQQAEEKLKEFGFECKIV